MALLMRAELARPGMQFLSPEQYNQLFTMHGTIMLLFFATPSVFAFANLVLPLQIGSPDVAFPRLNAFSYWLYLFGALTATVPASSRRAARPTAAGRSTCRSTTRLNSPGVGTDLWIIGLAIAGLGTILGGVNMITTVITLRAPGHDDVPDADLHLEHPGHQPAGAACVPDPDRGAARRCTLDRHLDAQVYAPATAARFSGSTCSGSSATPRSTSWRCRSSASSPRSSRCSAASRCSATRAWSSRRCRSRRCR